MIPPVALPHRERGRGNHSHPLPAVITEGQRNATLTSLAGTMRRKGFGEAAIDAALLVENATRCDPPLPESEVSQIARSVSRYAPAAESNGHAVEPVMQLISEVEPEQVTWLWPGQLAEGKITVLDGNPGLGKSTAALDIASRISRGDALPDGTQLERPRGVVLLSAEDGLADTIAPRLMAAGADTSRLFAMTGVLGVDGVEIGVTIPDQIPAIERAILTADAALLVVDPLMAYFSEDH